MDRAVLCAFLCSIRLLPQLWVYAGIEDFVFETTDNAFQELIFRLDGIKPYGWYLTLVQFWVYSALSYSEMKLSTGIVRR